MAHWVKRPAACNQAGLILLPEPALWEGEILLQQAVLWPLHAYQIKKKAVIKRLMQRCLKAIKNVAIASLVVKV